MSGNWKCPECHELVPANFAVCWNCGAPAPADATESTRATEEANVTDPTNSPPDTVESPPAEPFQFHLSTIFLATTIVAFIAAVGHFSGQAVLGLMLLGLMCGLAVWATMNVVRNFGDIDRSPFLHFMKQTAKVGFLGYCVVFVIFVIVAVLGLLTGRRF